MTLAYRRQNPATAPFGSATRTDTSTTTPCLKVKKVKGEWWFPYRSTTRTFSALGPLGLRPSSYSTACPTPSASIEVPSNEEWWKDMSPRSPSMKPKPLSVSSFLIVPCGTPATPHNDKRTRNARKSSVSEPPSYAPAYRLAFVRALLLGPAAARVSFALSSSSFASASRLPMPRTAAKAANCSFRGRLLPCSQL
jgi:hypothetical protein